MRSRIAAVLLAAVGAVACSVGPEPSGGAELRIAAWNMEHLAEADQSGCKPRTNADYVALRDYATILNADVIAFQEVESAEAAKRVFDPAIYDIVIETRAGTPNSRPPCNGAAQFHLNRQATGFAVRKGIRMERHADFTALQDGDPNLRSGVDITVTAAGGAPVRLLSVHLKSGCASGASGAACETLHRQAKTLETWVDARANEPVRFAVLGDFNRRLALPGDSVWAILDGPPGPADMTLAAGTRAPACDPRYKSFIDHIVIDPRIATTEPRFAELLYPGKRLSDHCPVSLQFT